MIKRCCLLFVFFRVYRPNIVIGGTAAPQTSPPSDIRGLPMPDPRPELDTPIYQLYRKHRGDDAITITKTLLFC